MKEIWIIGLGQFGLHALGCLVEKNRGSQFVLVDTDSAHLMRVKGSGHRLERMDGVSFLEQNLTSNREVDWIVPAVPIHLAAEWCLARQIPLRFRRVALPNALKPHLPNPMEAGNGDMYVSHADFRCPIDCPEPAHICTVTRAARKQNMFEFLYAMNVPAFESLVIRSHQLAPGVGGYRPGMLLELLDRVERAGGNLLISTACRCHGVVTALKPY